jgi:hypothetical protein
MFVRKPIAYRFGRCLMPSTPIDLRLGACLSISGSSYMMSAIMSIVIVIELAFVTIRYIVIYNIHSRFLTHIPSNLQPDIMIFAPTSSLLLKSSAPQSPFPLHRSSHRERCIVRKPVYCPADSGNHSEQFRPSIRDPTTSSCSPNSVTGRIRCKRVLYRTTSVHCPNNVSLAQPFALLPSRLPSTSTSNPNTLGGGDSPADSVPR